jgi:uncharacterized membrane protein YdbT with pleckstrin-like domain
MARDHSLIPGETPVIVVHPHWKVLVKPISLAVLIVAVVLVAIALIPYSKAGPAGILVLGAIAVVGVMWSLFLPLVRWRTTTYELTNRRLRLRYGVVNRFGHDVPLSRISDVSYETGGLDRVFGAGTLVVESPGERGEVRLANIPSVERVQATLFQLVEEEQQRAIRMNTDDGGA